MSYKLIFLIILILIRVQHLKITKKKQLFYNFRSREKPTHLGADKTDSNDVTKQFPTDAGDSPPPSSQTVINTLTLNSNRIFSWD